MFVRFFWYITEKCLKEKYNGTIRLDLINEKRSYISTKNYAKNIFPIIIFFLKSFFGVSFRSEKILKITLKKSQIFSDFRWALIFFVGFFLVRQNFDSNININT